MRLRIRHLTKYTYEEAARSALQVLRLTPRSSDGQHVKRWLVEVDADARLVKGEDAWGNITHTLFVEGPISSLTISIDGEIDTRDTGGVVSGVVERLPRPLYLRETALTHPTPALRTLAREASAAEGGDRLATLHRLMRTIHERLRFDTEATSVATTAGEAFAAGHGVCQDFAHIMAACARSLGTPARYVAGYFLRTDTHEQEAGHAWAEAWVDGIGWIGFDPAHSLCVTDRYVRVATGLDYLDAAPVRGTRIGGISEELSVTVHVEERAALIPVRAQVRQMQAQRQARLSQSQEQSSSGQSQRQGQQTQSQS